MGNHVRTRASASIPPLRPSEVTHARACRAGTQRPDSRSFKGASWPVRSCPSALRWMLLRRRWEGVRARVERVEETLALAVTQLVRASSQSWMIALDASYPSYAARVSPGVTG